MQLFHRIARQQHAPVPFMLDGRPCMGREGDTLLTAILNAASAVRSSEFSGSPRAGFCQMGACQDCWVTFADGSRARACTTPLVAGMEILTGKGAAS
ncbi:MULTISPECIES: (2Fe-2S)-binding protein [Phyllobacteriaceae]|uniref:(2Fe-2S)-binding protein n=1 Tax=Phyllobacterium phragmitis TaxID=2670329 RepID=A0ABQ0H3K9_9HYPH|nr:(2Fe-2S)-binding protein [Mesorhizobium sp. RMAD-H1]MBB2971512.1 putative molibdopterin-dependent oxidoreductase YjgC [Mesorhizobium sp. RMAD-H1]